MNEANEKPESPTSPVGNGGRTARGTFAPGNKLARGNPLNKRAQRLRSAYLRAVSPADLKAIATAMIDQAKKGDVAAAKEVCDRTIGKAVQQDLLERLEKIEAVLNQRQQERQWN